MKNIALAILLWGLAHTPLASADNWMDSVKSQINNAQSDAQATAAKVEAAKRMPAAAKAAAKPGAAMKVWNEDHWGDVKGAREKLQRMCGCVPEFKPKFSDFDNEKESSCVTKGIGDAADNLATECGRASKFGPNYKAQICSLVKSITVLHGEAKNGTANGDIVNSSTLSNGTLSFFCTGAGGTTNTGAKDFFTVLRKAAGVKLTD